MELGVRRHDPAWSLSPFLFLDLREKSLGRDRSWAGDSDWILKPICVCIFQGLVLSSLASNNFFNLSKLVSLGFCHLQQEVEKCYFRNPWKVVDKYLTDTHKPGRTLSSLPITQLWIIVWSMSSNSDHDFNHKTTNNWSHQLVYEKGKTQNSSKHCIVLGAYQSNMLWIIRS